MPSQEVRDPNLYSGGKARLGYVYASPLVRKNCARVERMDQLGTAKEMEMIREKLRKSELQVRFHAVVATASRFRELLNYGCRMIHYTGHGCKEFLAFESDHDRHCGLMEPLKVDRLKNLFQAGGVRTQLAFISSCSSELSGNAFVEAGVPHVVAVKVKEGVTEEAAQMFARTFYDALIGTPYTVKRAFEIAFNTVNAGSTDPQGGPFLLLPRDGNHDVRIFDQLESGDFIDETPPLPKVHPCLPSARMRYLGTEALQKVVETLVNPLTACATLTGVLRSGKTERAIQACKYLQERRCFDAIFFAACDEVVEKADSSPTRGWNTVEDPCSLIGRALGMDPAPVSIEQLAAFLFKKEEGKRSPCNVLLVLDGVDALFEERDWDARDNLLKMLSSLCAMSDRCHLRLLATSDFKLQRNTAMSFRNGTEKVMKVGPLANVDAAQLLFDNVSRQFTCGELRVVSGCSHADKMEALQKHPALLEAKGHPGTLLRLAADLSESNWNEASVVLSATRYWLEFQQRPDKLRRYSRASSTSSLASSLGGGCSGGGSVFGPNGSTSHDFGRAHSPTSPIPSAFTPAFSSDTRGHGGNAVCDGGGGGSGAWQGSGGGGHFLLAGGGMGGVRHLGPGRHSHYSPRPQQHPRRFSQQMHQRAVHELQGADEHDSLTMRPDEQRAFDTAREAGLNDTGCCLMWVQAITNAAAHGWSCDREDYPVAGGAAWGLPDRVPWDFLSGSLKDHLCRKLTIPSSRGQVVDRGPYAWLVDPSMELGGGGSYGAIHTPTLRGMNEEEMSFVRERLLRKQQHVWNASAGFGGSGRTERRASSGVGMRVGGLNIGENDMDPDTISIEAFTEFSKWWAPLITTLSRLRSDWSATSPVRVHGFMSRQETSTKLLGKEVGTFLLRFSESVAGALVVSFTEEVMQAPSTGASTLSKPRPPTLHVKNCLVHVNEEGRCLLSEGRGMARYDSLRDLVMGCENMLKLYPDIPKEVAFGELSSHWVYGGSSLTTPPRVVRSSGLVDNRQFGWGSRSGTGHEDEDEDEDESTPGLMLTDSDSDTALPGPE